MCDHKKIFGQNLQQVRTQKGLTQAQLAEKVSVTNATISNWESAYRSPDINDLVKLADALRVSLDYLAGRSESPKIYKPRKPPTEDA